MYDPLLGRTYAEIGADARSNHKCQGTSGLPALPGFSIAAAAPVRDAAGARAAFYQLIDSAIPRQKDRPETSLRRRGHQARSARPICRPHSARRADLRD